MDNENTQRKFESVYSTKVKAGRRRTYFFDVRRTKGDDYYITLTESTRKFNGDGYERHKIFLYKEDFNRFLESLTDAIDHVKSELMPDYNYEEFDIKQKEWEERQAAMENSTNHMPASEAVSSTAASETDTKFSDNSVDASPEEEDSAVEDESAANEEPVVPEEDEEKMRNQC